MPRVALDYVYPQLIPAVRVNMGPSAWYSVGAFDQKLAGPDRLVDAVTLPQDADPASWEVDTALEGIIDAMGDQPVVNLKPAPRPPQLSIDEVLSSYYTEGPALSTHQQGLDAPRNGTVIPHPDDLEPIASHVVSQHPQAEPPSQVNPTIAPPLPPPQPAGRSVLTATLAGLVAAVATVGLLAWLIMPRLSTVLQPPPSTHSPSVLETEPLAALTPAPQELQPAPEAAATPQATPGTSRRASRPASPRIISVLPGASATDVATESAPASAPVLSASNTPAMGTVVLRTIPSGATVSVDGDTVPKSAGNHTLTVGQHLLEVESSSGEITLIPVTISAGNTLEICYNFDTNSACVN